MILPCVNTNILSTVKISSVKYARKFERQPIRENTSEETSEVGLS